MHASRNVRLFRNGRNQAMRIPRQFELDADEAIIRKKGDNLIIQPIKRPQGLTALLAAWEPETGEFPQIHDSPAESEDIF